MKKWIHFTSLCFILTLTVACGGKNSSGGSSSSFSPLQQVSGNDANVLPSGLLNTSYGQQYIAIFNQALSWRNGAETGNILSTGFTKGVVAGSTSNNNCSTGTFLKIFNYQYCRGGSQQNSYVTFRSTPTQYCTVHDGSNRLIVSSKVDNNIPYNYLNCNLGVAGAEYSKANNTELNKVLSLNNGQWHLYGASSSGSQIYLMVGSKTVGPEFVYTIDTGYHSVYNPVSTQSVRLVGNQVYTDGDATKTLILTR